MRRFFRWPGIADLTIAILALVTLTDDFSGFFGDPGVGWHLRTGEMIQASHSVPKSDPFLALPVGQTLPRPWVSDQWLGDLIMWSSYDHGNWALAASLGFLIFTFTFLGQLYRAVFKASNSALGALVAALLAFKCTTIHFIFRPVLYSFPFVVYSAALARRLAVPTSGERFNEPKFVDFISIFLVFALWSNLHPSFPLGLILLSIVPVSRMVESVQQRHIAGRNITPSYSGLIFLILVAALGTLCNPRGIELHHSILQLAGSKFFMNFHAEWLPLDLKSPEGFIFTVIVATIIAAASFVPACSKNLRAYDVMSLLITGCLALRSVRMLPLFAIVAAFPFATVLSQIGRHPIFTANPAFKKLSSGLGALSLREEHSSRGGFGWIAILSLVGGVHLAGPEHSFNSSSLGITSKSYPAAALKRLAQASGSESITVVSTPDWGGFVVLNGYPRIRPVIDDRNTLLGEEAYKTYSKVLKGKVSPSDYAKSFNAAYILERSGGELDARLGCDPEFKEIYRDDISVLFESAGKKE